MGLFDKFLGISLPSRAKRKRVKGARQLDSVRSEVKDRAKIPPPDPIAMVDGKATSEWARIGKDDIELMKKCCVAEMKRSWDDNQPPAPFFFHRVAILSRKAKDYKQEVNYCEIYLNAIDEYLASKPRRLNPWTMTWKEMGINIEETLTAPNSAVKEGPRYKAIEKRLPKAKELLAKQK